MRPSNIVMGIAVRTTNLFAADRAPIVALVWVLSNLALGWIAVRLGHPNFGALFAGALNGAIFSSIVLVKASARLEAGMTGLLSGFGIDSITNSGHTIRGIVHGLHEGLEALVMASSTADPAHDNHQELESMIMRAIWMAIAVALLAFFVKWGQTPESAAAAPPAHAPAPVAVPAEMARAQAA